MAWISNSEKSPLTANQALTGAAEMFVEICGLMNVDPYQVLEAYWADAAGNEAEDFLES